MQNSTVSKLLGDAREVYGVFGKADRALTIVERALAIEPDNVEALNLKAAILFDMDRDDEAREIHQRALEIEPYSVEALHGLASIANEQRQYADALQWLARAFQAIPKDPYPEFNENEDYRQRLIAELYNEKAFALWFQGKKKEATDLLTNVAPAACPLEIETFEEEFDWLTDHPESPED